MKFEIKSRFTGATLFTAELEARFESEPRSRQIGEAVKQADLKGADLKGADLKGAYLEGAYLRGADLKGAYLEGADLRGADLEGAYLKGAYLRGADLKGADLRGADLKGAYLKGADLKGAYLPFFQIPQEGTLTVYKKLQDGVIAKLLVPADAKRTATPLGRKCRAEFVEVLELSEGSSAKSTHDGMTVYEVGKIVRPDSYNPDPRLECTNGIHFFLTKEEAERY